MFSYTETDIVPKNVFVFGCGGTGSRTIPPLLQLIKSQSNWLLNPSIYLIDGDVVEPKNCSRQNFIPMDVGKNKAEVLATRYTQAFGIPTRYYPHFFTEDRNNMRRELRYLDENHACPSSREYIFGDTISDAKESQLKDMDLLKMVQFLCGHKDVVPDAVSTVMNARSVYLGGGSNPSDEKYTDMMVAKSVCYDPCVVILCVDSAEARRNILQAMVRINPHRQVFVIDAGNEDIFGQVMLYRLDHRAPLISRDLIKKDYFVGPADRLHFLGNGDDIESVRRHLRSTLSGMKEKLDNIPEVFARVNSREYDALTAIDAKRARRLADIFCGGTPGLMGEDLPDVSSVSLELPILPCPDLFYDTLEEGVGTRSCADLDQTLAINNLMAAAIVNVVNNLVYGLAFDFNVIRISLNGGYHTERLTPYWLKQILLGKDPNFSTFLARKAWEEAATPSPRGKEEALEFLRNMMLNGYYFNGGGRTSVYGLWSEDGARKVTALLGNLAPLLQDPQASSILELVKMLPVISTSVGQEGRDMFMEKAESMTEEQVNTLIDLISYLTTVAGKLDHTWAETTNQYDLHMFGMDGMALYEILFGDDKVISLHLSPNRGSRNADLMYQFLRMYQAEAFIREEITEENFNMVGMGGNAFQDLVQREPSTVNVVEVSGTVAR